MCLLQPPDNPKRDKREPLPYWVDVHADRMCLLASRLSKEGYTRTLAILGGCTCWSECWPHGPSTASRLSKEPLPYWVDVHADLSLCWPHRPPHYPKRDKREPLSYRVVVHADLSADRTCLLQPPDYPEPLPYWVDVHADLCWSHMPSTASRLSRALAILGGCTCWSVLIAHAFYSLQTIQSPYYTGWMYMLICADRTGVLTIQRGINENPCHTGWIYRLIWVCWSHKSYCMFCRALAQARDKTDKMACAPSEDSDQPGRLSSHQSSLCTQWVAKDLSFLHADRED